MAVDNETPRKQTGSGEKSRRWNETKVNSTVEEKGKGRGPRQREGEGGVGRGMKGAGRGRGTARVNEVEGAVSREGPAGETKGWKFKWSCNLV